jgi:hypothetical protein
VRLWVRVEDEDTTIGLVYIDAPDENGVSLVRIMGDGWQKEGDFYPGKGWLATLRAALKAVR